MRHYLQRSETVHSVGTPSQGTAMKGLREENEAKENHSNTRSLRQLDDLIHSLNSEFRELKSMSQEYSSGWPLEEEKHLRMSSSSKSYLPAHNEENLRYQQQQPEEALQGIDPNENLEMLARRLNEIAANLSSPPKRRYLPPNTSASSESALSNTDGGGGNQEQQQQQIKTSIAPPHVTSSPSAKRVPSSSYARNSKTPNSEKKNSEKNFSHNPTNISGVINRHSSAKKHSVHRKTDSSIVPLLKPTVVSTTPFSLEEGIISSSDKSAGTDTLTVLKSNSSSLHANKNGSEKALVENSEKQQQHQVAAFSNMSSEKNNASIRKEIVRSSAVPASASKALLQLEPMQSIKVHRHRVNCLAAHKTLLFSGSHDYYLRAISQLDFSQVAACRHARHVTALVNDDRLLVSGAQDTLIRVFSLENVLQRLTVLRGHSGRVNSLALFSAAHLASCANDEELILWDLARGCSLRAHTLQCGRLNAVAAGEEFLIAGGQQCRGVLYDARDGEPVFALQPLAAPVLSIAVEASAISIGCADGHFYVFDTRELGAPIRHENIGGCDVRSIRRVPQFEDAYILAATNGLHIVENGNLLCQQPQKFNIEENSVEFNDVVVSYNRVYAARSDMKIDVFRI